MPKKRTAGRPLKYGEKTVSILIRIPKSKKKIFKGKVAAILKKWEKK